MYSNAGVNLTPSCSSAELSGNKFYAFIRHAVFPFCWTIWYINMCTFQLFKLLLNKIAWLYPGRAVICHAALGVCIFYDKENKIPYGHNKLQERPLEHHASSG